MIGNLLIQDNFHWHTRLKFKNAKKKCKLLKTVHMKNNIYDEIGHIFTRDELSDAELILEDHLFIQDDLLVTDI